MYLTILTAMFFENILFHDAFTTLEVKQASCKHLVKTNLVVRAFFTFFCFFFLNNRWYKSIFLAFHLKKQQD